MAADDWLPGQVKLRLFNFGQRKATLESLALMASIVMLTLIAMPALTLLFAWLNMPIITLLCVVLTVGADVLFLRAMWDTVSSAKLVGWFGLGCSVFSLYLLMRR